MMNNLAIISPNKKVFSETFIQAHKNLLKGTIHYLYDGIMPFKSEFTNQNIAPDKYIDRKIFALKYILFNAGLSRPQYALKLYLKKYKIQCVLAEFGLTGAKVYSVCEHVKIPLIVHFHGFDASVYDVLEDFKSDYQKMFSVAKYIIGVSSVMVGKLKELGVEENKLLYNTYGPDDTFFEIEIEQDHSPLFFGVGRFVDKKAPYYTIIAFSEVLKNHPNANLVLGGDGPLLEVSINLTRYLGIDHNVEFPGILTPDEVRKYLTKATAFVQHSITARDGDMEGTPVGILEASAAGLPVISTIHAGIPDVIKHEKTGLLCEERDYNKMAEHMIWVLENSEKAVQMGKEGRNNIKENYSMDRHINKLNEIIEKAIND